MALHPLWYLSSLHSAADGEREPAGLGEGFLLARPRRGEEPFCPLSTGKTVTWSLIRSEEAGKCSFAVHLLQKEVAVSATAAYLDFVKHRPDQRNHVWEPDSACQPPVWDFFPTHHSLQLRKNASKSPNKSLTYTETSATHFTQLCNQISVWKLNLFFLDYNFVISGRKLSFHFW